MPRLFPALIRRTLGQGRYVLLGCWGLLCAMQLVIVGQASAIEEQQSFGRLTELVPAFLQRGLGSRAMLLATFKGTVAFGYFHPVVVVLVSLLAAYFTTEAAHEVEAGLVDVELARPMPRHTVITRSLVAGAIAVGVAALLMTAGTRIGLSVFASPHFDAPPLGLVSRLVFNLAAVAALFGAFGVALAAGARRWSTAFFSTALAVVVLYLIDFLAIGWPLMRSIAWLSPFHYYPALSIIAGDAPLGRNIGILLAATAVFASIGYWRFERRDL
jgi:ABC-2 type transport system permease protein